MSKQLERSCCAADEVLAILNGKWKTVILCRLHARPCRYSELRAAIPGLSDKMLTQRLHDLISCGLVAHQHGRGAPPGIYVLTSKGRLLDHLLQNICAWGQQHCRSLCIDVKASRPCRGRRRA